MIYVLITYLVLRCLWSLAWAWFIWFSVKSGMRSDNPASFNAVVIGFLATLADNVLLIVGTKLLFF
jgi:hypothetical protein